MTVNISSPNTSGLRELQDVAALEPLLAALKAEQAKLAQKHGKYTPLVVKIAPDLSKPDIGRIARTLVEQRIDGVIATNTTVDRSAVGALPHGDEAGGLSGAPLRDKATAAVRALAQALDGALPIIGVGGIMSGDDAREKIAAGATLVQIYTGLIYRGRSSSSRSPRRWRSANALAKRVTRAAPRPCRRRRTSLPASPSCW